MSSQAPPFLKDSRTLFVFGSSHRTAPLELRERIALENGKMEKLCKRLKETPGLDEFLVLNTCNRVEIYGVSHNGNLKTALQDSICSVHGMPREHLEAHTYWKANHEMLEHLFYLTTGMDSQMVGETEIFGQVKESYNSAQKQGTVGKTLNHVFQKSFKEAKWARTHTAISKGQVSIGNVVVDLAARIFGKLKKSKILLIGSGEVGEKTAQALKSRGVKHITVTSRTFENAHHLAHTLGGASLDLDNLESNLSDFDIIISSTASNDLLLTHEQVKHAQDERRGDPLFLIDLALPRDIDPAVAELENVFIYNLDDLSKIANQNLQTRLGDMDQLKQTFSRRAWAVWLTITRR